MKATQKQRKKISKKGVLKTIGILLLIGILLVGIAAAVNYGGISYNRNFIGGISPVAFREQLKPVKDSAGRYTFVTDREFKILQLSDIHIGGGFMSIRKDNAALNAVAAMITAEQPDLVVITGDLTYPVPVQAGTFNNKENAKLLADLMEQLGVYWAAVFGNHDSESYSYYSRETIGALYESEAYPHCLFQIGAEEADGVGNYVINVKNSAGAVTQSLFFLDSHAYLKGNLPGISWKYDAIHENQVDWYETEVRTLTAENGGVQPKSLAFFHIPLQEMQDAYYAYRDNGFQDTAEVQFIYGKVGEKDIVVYPGDCNYGFFDRVLSVGSTQGIFFGHDHLNNFSLQYKGVRMTYGCTVDYLAYKGIKNYGAQRGCTVITVQPDGSFDCWQENYYQDKYQPPHPKETVRMDDYYTQ